MAAAGKTKPKPSNGVQILRKAGLRCFLFVTRSPFRKEPSFRHGLVP